MLAFEHSDAGKRHGLREVWSVPEITGAVARKFEDVPAVWVEAEIQEILFRERVDSRFAAWLDDLRKHSHIKIMGAP